MARPFDTTLKHLVEAYPRDWLRLLGVPADGPVEVLDADLATVTAEADKVLRVGGPAGSLFQLELQASYDAALPDRMLLYSVLLQHRHRAAVRSTVLLLRPAADGPAMSGLVSRGLPDFGPYLDFRYRSVRMWEVPVDAVLAAGVGTLPLAPLAAGAAGRLDDVLDRLDRRVTTEIESSEAADLWAATYVLLGLSYPPEVGQALLRRVRSMEESVTYQAIIAKGRDQGRREGRSEGRNEGFVEGARRVLLAFGERRLGPPDPTVRRRIDAIADFDRLERLTERVPEVGDWAELLGEP